MRTKPILVLCLLTAVWSGCAHTVPGRAEATAATDGDYTPAQFAAAILTETNRVRHQYHLQQLYDLPALDLAADDQASYMALQLSAQHDNALAGEGTPAARIFRRGVRPQACAENVASIPVWPTGEPKSVSEIAAALVEAWMNSPGHRANLLDPEFTHLGSSVRVAHGAGAWYAFGAQDFVTLSARP
jgi:uncharacterized protein YkwD